ncbi:alpha/beta hydrolase [Saccharothrix coeruleofusca]|uniref:alpha/beta hydrolase n=1 Tax=Saccharothrix coeruleofusca TaxID=33919 RepID=UPI00166F6BCE|nr:alpha/beta hydrolase [Saccharothrix coeruleofusca]
MRRSLLLALALPLLASCTTLVTGEPRAGTTLEQRGPAGAVPSGLERFYGQQLAWEDCEPYATNETTQRLYRGKKNLECTRLEVPLDYGKPDGRTIKVGLLRQPASGERIGSLLLNPGGPGVSGMSTAAQLAPGVRGGELGERFDLVGFDPRGVGSSEPRVRCLSDADRDAERLDVDLDTSPQGIAETERENKVFADKCAASTGVELLAAIGTREVVQDLDVMRSVLGDEKLTYLGYSYGTHIGAEYAEKFPGNVRALLLDGAVDPVQNQVESLVAQGAGFQKAFTEFAAWCGQRQDCALGSGDPNTAFRELTLPLAERPVEVGDRKLSYSDAITAAIQALYSSQLWQALNTGLNELRDNNGETLLTLADAYYDRDGQGRYSTLTDAFVAINCVDDERVTDRAVLDEVARRYKQAAPFLDDGRPAVGALDPCAFWPVPVTNSPGVGSVQGLPPVLVVSTTGDPATPYQAGVSLAGALGGRLLTFEGTQHTVYLQGNTCVDEAGDAYLISGTLPAEGTRCS